MYEKICLIAQIDCVTRWNYKSNYNMFYDAYVGDSNGLKTKYRDCQLVMFTLNIGFLLGLLLYLFGTITFNHFLRTCIPKGSHHKLVTSDYGLPFYAQGSQTQNQSNK
jgi:hypothetical protein